MSLEPKPIAEIIGDVVETVKGKILTTLQANDDKIKTIHYEYGHPSEIIATLMQFTESPTKKFEKYPIVMLFQDLPEDKVSTGGYYEDVSLHIVIASSTSPTYKASERYSRNFNPILYPLYYAFIKYLARHPLVVGYTERTMKHSKIDRVFWGKEGIYQGKANPFEDYLDAIEIPGLQLKINYQSNQRSIYTID